MGRRLNLESIATKEWANCSFSFSRLAFRSLVSIGGLLAMLEPKRFAINGVPMFALFVVRFPIDGWEAHRHHGHRRQ
jgi:hypothetical protein